MEDEERMIWKASISPSLSESSSMVSATVGRVMTTLLTARPKKLQDSISRLHSAPKKGSIGVSLEQSLWFLHNYVREAVEKEDSMDEIFIPILEHSLRHKDSKHGNQAMILLNWLFQDEHLFQAVVTNLASIIMRKDDHYIALGWCTLVHGLVDYENTMNQFKSDGMRKKYSALLKIFGSCIMHLLTIARNGSTLQGGFELPTRLSVAAADCILALTVALAETVVSDTSDNRSKTSNPSSSDASITLLPDTSKKVKPTSEGPNVSNLEMKKLLWDHLDKLTILVERLVAWSRKSWSLHAKGLERVLKWLQEIKGQYGCFQDEAGSRFLKTGVLLLSSCWKHYGMLMHLEDYKFSQHFKELLDQYLSGIQFYADNMEEQDENKESGIETIKFFLNCLSLLLGRLDGKKFESTMSEYGLQISRVLISQLHCAEEDVIDSSVWIFKTVIFKANNSSSGSNLYNASQMDSVLSLLLHLLDEGVGTAKAIIMLIAEYCSISTDGRCLQEVLKRLASGNVLQRRNAIDVILELISISLDSIYSRQDVANCLLEGLGDEELSIRAQASHIIPMMDPALVLPTLVRLVYSSDEGTESSASNTVITVLKYHKEKVEVICILLDCLSNLWQNTNLPNASAEGGEGSKLDTDRVLKLIPEWSKSVEDWNLLIEPLIDKMFAEPSNAIIVRFLSCISEHLADSADVLFRCLLLHTRGQEGFEDSFFSGCESRRCTGEDSVKLQHTLFDRLCPLLIIRLLPLRVFNDLNSSIIYGELLEQHVLHDNGYFSIGNADCVVGLLLNRAFNKLEFEDVRKLAAELCGRIYPQVLFPIVSSQLENATSVQDALKIKACLFSMCTSLVVRGRDSISHPVMLRIKKAIETVLSWPSLDGDEVSKAQHGCIDFLALMICTELQGPQSFKHSNLEKISKGEKNSCSGDAAARNSVLTYVIDQLTHDEREVVSSELSSKSCTPGLSVPLSLSFRLCMANVLISASQKVSDSVKKPFAQKLLPHLIRSTEVMMESDIRAACVQVLFSAVYHLKASVGHYSSDLLSVSLKSLSEGSEKEKIAGAKLLASLMASEETVVESISGGLLEARSVLSSISLSHPSPELRQICEKLLMCVASP